MLLHADSAEVFPKFSFAILDALHSYAIDYTTIDSTRIFGAHPKTTQTLMMMDVCVLACNVLLCQPGTVNEECVLFLDNFTYGLTGFPNFSADDLRAIPPQTIKNFSGVIIKLLLNLLACDSKKSL